MKTLRTLGTMAVGAGIVLVTLLVQHAVAGGGPITTVKSGKAITAVKVLRSHNTVITSSSSFLTLASVNIAVPPGSKALLLARLSGESACVGSEVGDYCSIRLVVNGNEMTPAVGTDAAFDSVSSTSEEACSAFDCGWESHSLDRSATVGAGTHTVSVQWAVVDSEGAPGSPPEFWLDDWSLTVERVTR